MLAICTTTYTVLDNKEGQEFAKNFINIHEWGGAQVRKVIDRGVIKLSIDSVIETKELIYEEEK